MTSIKNKFILLEMKVCYGILSVWVEILEDF